MNNNMLSAALFYAQQGFMVLPVHSIDHNGQCTCKSSPENCKPGKHPILMGGHKIASKHQEQIIQWWTDYPWANVAIKTGRESNLFVLDIDGPEGYENFKKEFPESLAASHIALTGGGGYHLYYQYIEGVSTKHGFRYKIDLMSDNAYVLAPPSIHKSGYQYTWQTDPNPCIKPDIAPQILIDFVHNTQQKPRNKSGDIVVPVNIDSTEISSEVEDPSKKDYPLSTEAD